MLRTLIPFLFLVSSTVAGQEWPQWGGNPQHGSRVNIVGQSLDRNFVSFLYDSLVNQEVFFSNGSLLAHYQAPLVDGNDVYMMNKTGVFDTRNFATQNWFESKYAWRGNDLVQSWQFATDWKPFGSLSDYWEPVFHPALANNVLYVPGANGSVFKVNKLTGVGVRINPFASESNVYVVSPLTADAAGNIIYNVIKMDPAVSGFLQRDVLDSFLVRIQPNDTFEKVSYSTLATPAPRGTDQCSDQFISEPLPWPPSASAVPRTITCGTQRPGVNIAPAVAPDGTIYVVTRAQFNSREAFLIAVTPQLQKSWIASLRNRLSDGCGVPRSQGGVLPPNGAIGGCRAGANLGVDPQTNLPGDGRVNDSGTSSPVVAPDGSIFYGAQTRYNYSQGHLIRFSRDGGYLGAYPFGWDVTPGIYPHDGTYSVVIKENRYSATGYCADPLICETNRNVTNPEYPVGYFITQLSPDLRVEWSYRNMNTESCSRQTDGSIRCVSNEPDSFEWCVNGFVIDANGVVYANSEDGWLYAIAQGGTLKKRIFQQLALGAAYTPTSMDAAGRVYSQNAGRLFVTGATVPRRRTGPLR